MYWRKTDAGMYDKLEADGKTFGSFRMCGVDGYIGDTVCWRGEGLYVRLPPDSHFIYDDGVLCKIDTMRYVTLENPIYYVRYKKGKFFLEEQRDVNERIET